MDIKKIKSIKFALMEKQHDVDVVRAEFIAYTKGILIIPENFDYDQFSDLIESIFNDLIKKQKNDDDYLGIWVNYNEMVYENSLAINALTTIKQYNSEDINPVYELIKMTLPD